MIFALASAMLSRERLYRSAARLAWRGAFEEFGRSGPHIDTIVTTLIRSDPQ